MHKTVTFLQGWNKYELSVLLVAIPIFMTLIFFLPDGVKQGYFILYATNQNIPALFLQNYTHSDPTHFLSSLFSYLMLVILLLKTEVNKKNFRSMMLLLLILLPWIVSLSSLYLIPYIPPVQGLSGIVAGFLGYFVYSVYNYLRKVHNLPLNSTFVLFIFLLNVVLTPMVFKVATLEIGLVLFSIVLAYMNRAGLLALSSHLRAEFRSLKKVKPSERLYKVIFFSLALVMMFQLPLLLPSEIVVGATLINVVAHYVGYMFGLLLPLIAASGIAMLQAVSKIERNHSSSKPFTSPKQLDIALH